MAAATHTVREECFARLGYVHAPITAREDAEFDAIQDWDAKMAWIDDFMVRRSQERVRRIVAKRVSSESR